MDHTICRMKKYRIVMETFGNRLRKYNRILNINAGIVTFRTINYDRYKKNPYKHDKLSLIIRSNIINSSYEKNLIKRNIPY